MFTAQGLRLYKAIELSEQEKLKFFLDKHSTKEGTWGYLQLTQGEIDFVFLNGKGEELRRQHLNQQQHDLMIPPACWHKIVPLSKEFQASLQFYCLPHRYFHKKYGLAQVHSDLLYVYQGYLQQLSHLKILDVGCGSGRNPLFLAAQGHSVTGIDHNPSSLQQLAEIAQKEGLIELELLNHDLHQPLELAEKSYHFVYSTVSLQFLAAERIPSLLKEIQQATVPQGLNFLVFPIKAEPFSYPQSFHFLAEKNELYHFYQDAGWAILEYKEAPGLLHKLDESGKPIQGLFALLVAQRLSS